MKDKERRSYEMLARVRDYGATHAAEFPTGSRGNELFTSLSGVVEELEAHAAAQSSNASAAVAVTGSRAAARETLWADLEAISRTAQGVSATHPGADERFRLPRRNRNDVVLLATARAFLADARPLKAEFVSYELPADFLESLEAHIGAFESSVTEQNRRAVGRVAATNSIGQAVERGAELTRQIDAIVRNKFKGDPAKLAAWESASRTERARRRSKAEATEPQPA